MGPFLKVKFLIFVKGIFLFVTKPLSFFKDEQSLWRSIILRIEWCSIFGQYTRCSRRLSNNSKDWCLSCWAIVECYSIKLFVYQYRDVIFQNWFDRNQAKSQICSPTRIFVISRSEHFKCHKLYKWKLPSI